MPSHTHQLRGDEGAADEEGDNDPAGNLTGVTQSNEEIYNTSATNLVNMAPQAIVNNGGNQVHNNLQPLLTINYIIGLVGMYPSRS